jgi:probable HAF family extracellular repeat protein
MKRVGGFYGLLACAMALAAAPTKAQAQSYSITDLGGLPGATGTVAWGINDFGTVVGWSGGSGLNFGFIWNNGVMKNIGSLPGGNPGSGLFAVNGLGQAVGVANPGSFNGNLSTQGILYRNNTMTTIDTSANSLFAHYITDTGVIVGDYLKNSSSGTLIPASWTEDPSKPGRFRRTDLLPVSGDFAAYANAANQSLIIVGTTASQARGNQACVWNNDPKHTPIALAPGLADQTAVAEGVNNLGAACGFSWLGIYRTTPIVWSADASHTPTALPWLPGTTHAWARAINNLGQVIGYGGDASGAGGTLQTTGATPVIWLNGQIYTLQSVLDASGAGWTNVEGVAINNAGQIAGNGIHNGVPSAFIMTPNVGL